MRSSRIMPGKRQVKPKMVHRLDAADLAALAFLKGFDGVSSGMWLQLQSLLKGDTDQKGMDPAEISKLVKNILETSQKEIPMNVLNEALRFPHLIRVLASLSKPSQLDVQLCEKSGDPSKPNKAMSEKMDQNPNPQTAPQHLSKEKSAEFVEKQRQMPKLPMENPVASKAKPPHAEPMETALKGVLQALNQLDEQFKSTEEKKFSDPHIAAKEAPKQERMLTPQKSSHLESSTQEKKPQHSDSKPVSAKPEIHVETKQTKPHEEKVIERQVQSSQTQVKEDKIVSSVSTHTTVVLNKKEAELQMTTSSKGFAQAQTTTQAQSSEKTVIPAAPYQTQFQATDLRRKEKKKYPHYFSDNEEGEEGSDHNDPNPDRK